MIAGRHVPGVQPAVGAPAAQHTEHRRLLDRAGRLDAGHGRSAPAPRVRLPGTGSLVATERRPDPVPVPLRNRQLPLAGEVNAASAVPPHELVKCHVIQGKGHRSMHRRQVAHRGQDDADRHNDHGAQPCQQPVLRLRQLRLHRRDISLARRVRVRCSWTERLGSLLLLGFARAPRTP
jgi:hypothetical protein